MNYTVKIPFTPKPKTSVVVTKHGAFNPCYKYQLSVRESIKRQLTLLGATMIPENPVLVIMQHYFPWKRKKGYHKENQGDNLPFLHKPDIDNIAKLALDAMNSVCWKDDSQVVWLLQSKLTSCKSKGFTIVTVFELEKKPQDLDYIIEIINQNLIYPEEFHALTE